MASTPKLVERTSKPTSVQPRDELKIKGDTPNISAKFHHGEQINMPPKAQAVFHAESDKERLSSTYYRDRLNKEIQMRSCQKKSSRELVIFEDEEEAKMLWKDIFEPLSICEILMKKKAIQAVG